MKTYFENLASDIKLPLLYARPSLANVKLDDLELSDFNQDGLLLIVSPIYTSGLPIENYGRVKRLFEISVVAMHDLDFNDSDVDDKLDLCEEYLLKIIKKMNVDVQSANQFVSKFDINLCGVFANVFFTNKNKIC